MYITYFYPYGIIQNNNINLVEKLNEKDCTLNVGIYKCKLMNDKYGIFPYGFAFVNEDHEPQKRIFFNGKIINDSANKALGITRYIVINNDFCIPYDETTDKVMALTI